MKSFFTIVFLLAFSSLSFAQTIDKKNKTIHDTVKIKQLNETSQELIKNGSKEGLNYANEALRLSKKNNFVSGQIEALINISRNYVYVKQDFDSSIFFLKKAILESNKKKVPEQQADLYLKVGTAYLFKGNSDSALLYINNALPIFETLKDSAMIIRVRNNLGIIYFNSEKYNKAIENFFVSLRFNELKKDSVFMSNDYNNIGSVLKSSGDFDGARYYFDKAMQIRASKNDSAGIGEIYLNLGNVFIEEKKFDLALDEFNKGLNYISKNDNKSMYLKFLNNKGICYGNLNQPEKELENYLLVFSISNEIGKTDGLSDIYLNIASCYYRLNNYDKAIDFYNIALEDAIKSNQLETQQTIYKSLLRCYVKTNEKELALITLDKFVSIHNSINKSQANQQIQELKITYETEKKEAQIKSQQQLLNKEKREKILYISILALGLALLSILIFVIRNRNKHKTELLLKEQSEIALIKVLEAEERERTRIAKDLHDGIVQDLTAIKNNIKLTLNTPEKSKENLEIIYNELDKTSKEVREISYQMMPLTLKEFGLEKALDTLLNRTLSAHQITFDFNTVGIEQRLPEKIEVSVYRICQELLNNSLKHSKASRISLLLMSKNNTLSVTYEDNGIGFDAKNIEKGIGLNSLKSRIEMIKGNLEFDSEINKGTTAYIKIPL
jgi:signal transduction histidine kinase/Tfp pilus assembly protein PilF